MGTAAFNSDGAGGTDQSVNDGTNPGAGDVLMITDGTGNRHDFRIKVIIWRKSPGSLVSGTLAHLAGTRLLEGNSRRPIPTAMSPASALAAAHGEM